MERLIRILHSVTTFDVVGKDLRWIYCHQFQSYAPPDNTFVTDETVHHFGRFGAGPEPLTFRAVVLPGDADERYGVHWLREAPKPAQVSRDERSVHLDPKVAKRDVVERLPSPMGGTKHGDVASGIVTLDLRKI